ncbi:class I fructose-bisphosphate aldolase [Aliiroseovarius sp.]|uniref:class I fructose-bisphosphate aldolase n=1 Tax=Aliiroseovarius sp. TaxID=1872442 RepID=UPI003BAB9983
MQLKHPESPTPNGLLTKVLALDHGLTQYSGSVDLATLRCVLSEATPHFGSVVMNYGMARHFNSLLELPLIVQCFGAPFTHYKFTVCGVSQAIDLGAVGISVQVDFDLEEEQLSQQLSSVSRIIGEAHQNKLPVMFMVSVPKEKNSANLMQQIRFCYELGADVIKTWLPDESVVSEETKQQIHDKLVKYPPVVMAGGEQSSKIVERAKFARCLGLSGYCIGRNVYQSDNPAKVAIAMEEIWKDKI